MSIPSLTLYPSGDERSIISLHFPGLDFLGITPKGLICRGDIVAGSVPIRSAAFSPTP